MLHDLNNLPVPKHWVDPVTQLWPEHISPAFREQRAAADAAAAAGGQVRARLRLTSAWHLSRLLYCTCWLP